MLKKSHQWKYLRKRCKRSLARLEGFALGNDGKELHKLRLELKKIDAFLQFYRSCGNDSGLAKYDVRTIKKIFRQAGKIRDAQIYLELSQAYPSETTAFQTEQRSYIKAKTDKFVSKARHYRKKIEQVRQSLKTRIHPIKADRIRSWYAKQLRKARKGLLAPQIEKLHMSRKRIKPLLYINKLLSGSKAIPFHLNVEYLDALQNDIGQWHDLVSLGKLLGEKRVAPAIIQELAEHANERIKAIQATGQDFLKKAKATGK